MNSNYYMSEFQKDHNVERSISSNFEVVINHNAYKILDTIMQTFLENKPPYDEAVLPQAFKPERFFDGKDLCGSSEHAMYFWNICSYMSGRIKSDLAFHKMTDIFNEHPELFDANCLAETDVTTIENILRNHGLGRQNKVATQWIKNAQKLVERFDGDPRNIFKNATTYQECVNHIKNDGSGDRGFLGFREKMTSMILYFLIDEGLIQEIAFPVPVDFHAIRVSLATEMVSTEPKNIYRTNSKLEDTLRILFQNYIHDKNINPLDLTNAIWLLSSNLCNKNIGHLSDRIMSKNGLEFIFKDIKTDNLKHSENWHKTCGRCALEQYCKYYIPAGPYYAKSAITPIEKPKDNFIKQISFDDLLPF